MASIVLPQPAPPQIKVVRPLGRPPPVISSSPRTPVATLDNGRTEATPRADRPVDFREGFVRFGIERFGPIELVGVETNCPVGVRAPRPYRTRAIGPLMAGGRPLYSLPGKKGVSKGQGLRARPLAAMDSDMSERAEQFSLIATAERQLCDAAESVFGPIIRAMKAEAGLLITEVRVTFDPTVTSNGSIANCTIVGAHASAPDGHHANDSTGISGAGSSSSPE